jgi:UDP-GlcNAc:undecaprenyl-phosphate GlcNAc-1-phosphate transferase
MYSLMFLALLSCVLSFVFTPIVRRLAHSRGWLDRPDGERKSHRGLVARGGGLAVAAAYVLSYGVWLLTPLDAGRFLAGSLPMVWKLLPVAALILAIGLLDDVRGLRAKPKLFVQTLAACLAYWAGIRMENLLGNPIHGALSFVLTVAWLLVCMNAFNLIDGMDGLASGLGLTAAVTLLIASLIHGNVPLALAVAPLAGALLAFLRYNLPPASIFLGDSGSLLIGFLLGCYAIMWSQKAFTLLGLLAPLAAFAVPLLDTSIAVVRRFLRGKSIFSGDRGHIHHRLLDRGLTHWKAVLVLYGVAIAAAAFALAQTFLGNLAGAPLVVLFLGLVWIGVQSLGYVEFTALRRTLRAAGLRSHVMGQIAVEELLVKLDKAKDVDGCWQAIVETARACGFDRTEGMLRGQYHESKDGECQTSWQLRITLPEGDWIAFCKAVGAQSTTALPGSLSDAVHGGLRAKLYLQTGRGVASGG